MIDIAIIFMSMFTGSYTLTDTLVLQELKKIGQPVGFQHPCLLHFLFAWTVDLWKWRSWEKHTSSGWKYSKNISGEREWRKNNRKQNGVLKPIHEEEAYDDCCTLAICVSVFAGSYILAETRLPLACTVAAKNKENWIRFGLWFLNMSSAVVVIILWICWQCTHDKR